jgi:hypothetical protein
VEQPEEIDLPFTLGNGDLDADEVARAEYHNARLGVLDPVQRRLNVLWWLYQHYQESGDTDTAMEVKAGYDALRNANPDLVRLTRIGELDEGTLLRRLVNGQKWLTLELEKWATDNQNAASDTNLQKTIDGWVAMEIQLREQHGYRGCIHGEGRRCPENVPAVCNFCAGPLLATQAAR